LLGKKKKKKGKIKGKNTPGRPQKKDVLERMEKEMDHSAKMTRTKKQHKPNQWGEKKYMNVKIETTNSTWL